MPEVVRRKHESVTGAARFNVRVSKTAADAIRAAAERDGFDNAVQWCRVQLEKAAGYEAPVEEVQRAPWEVGGESND